MSWYGLDCDYSGEAEISQLSRTYIRWLHLLRARAVMKLARSTQLLSRGVRFSVRYYGNSCACAGRTAISFFLEMQNAIKSVVVAPFHLRVLVVAMLS